MCWALDRVETITPTAIFPEILPRLAARENEPELSRMLSGIAAH
jgi:hypothetical protein